MFAAIFLPQAQAAAIAGTAPVGAGAIVELIEINNTGAKVGSTIASTTTAADGSYTLNAPSTFAAATKYVVRVTSSSDATKYLDSIVTSTSLLDIDPATDVTKTLVINAASGVGLSTVTPQTVASIQSTVTLLANDATFADLATAKTAIMAQCAASEEIGNIVGSLASSSAISGTITDSQSAALPNIKIIVRDYNNWVTRATTLTDATGKYTLHVPNGSYIVGAINATTTSTAASEWWTTGGGAANQFSAGKVTVAGTATTLADFVLDAGVRISGTVTGETTTLPVQGVMVQLRDFTNDEPVTQVYTNSVGSYTINVKAGTYTLGAYNQTIQPYASELYNNSLNGGISASQAEKIVLGTTNTTADFSLKVGNQISGVVTDGASGPVVPGIGVRFYTYTGAFVNGIRANNLGQYRFWLRPNPTTASAYTVRSRGQAFTVATAVDLSTGDKTGKNFTTAMGTIIATLSDGTNPVSQAKVFFYDAASPTPNYLGFEVSNSDGTVTLYATAPVKISPGIDNGAFIATQFYNGAGGMVSSIGGAGVNSVAVGSAPTITLNAGGVLSGIVSVGATPAGDRIVQVRSGGTAAINYLANARTQLDGSYSISLPAGTFNVRACNPDPTAATNCNSTTGNTAWAISPAITAGSPTSLNLTSAN